jgi:hypothetical protein
MTQSMAQSTIAPLDQEELCRLYRDSEETVASLMARSGLRASEFYQLLRDRGLPLRRPRRSNRSGNTAPDPERPRKPVRREDLIARLWEAASGHMAQIETRLARLDQEQSSHPPAAGTESELRIMGLIVKTLRDLAALDADVAGARKKEMVQDDLAAELATCPESMRAELARRLAGLREGR